MRKTFLTILLAIVASVGTLFADGTKIGDLYYILDLGKRTATVTYSKVTFGETIYFCYNGCYNEGWSITTANIPSSVYYNGIYYTVTAIGDHAFGGTNLSVVTIPNSITSIASNAFPTSNVSAIYFSGSIEEWCTKTWSPSNVSVSYNLYINDEAVVNAIIPNSITSIARGAFAGCANLTSITIPNTVTSIGYNAFYNCSSLREVYINDLAAWCAINFGEIPDSSQNNPLTQAHHLYLNNSEITELVIPDKVTSISAYAFSGCENFTSVTIPNTITSIGYGAFYNCSKLKEVHINDLAAWCATNFNYKYEFGGCGNPLDYAHHLYLDDIEITNLVVPSNITSISASAFTGCESFTSVSFPNSITTIGSYAFSGCINIKSIILPASINSIGEGAFGNSGLQYATLLSLTPPTLSFDYAVSVIFPYDIPIYVPCGTLDSYASAWNGYNTYNFKYGATPILSVACNSEYGQVTKETGENICDILATITAVPNIGYHFAQWSDGDINNPRTVQLLQDTSFTAEFEKNIYTITASPNNVEYGYTTGGKTTEYLDEITLTATAQSGHHFEYWQCGSNKYKNNPLTITVQEDAAYTAFFAPNVYTLTTNANASQGYVTAPAQAEFLQEVKMTATPLNGYAFVQWNDGVKDNPRMVQLTQDTTFTAEFAKAQYTISTDFNNGDWGHTTGDTVVEYLTAVTLTAIAHNGYHFDHWELWSGSKTYTANPLTITATDNATYMAWFKPNTYSVNVYSENSSWGSVSAPSSGEYLSSITLIAEPVKGAKFVQWSDGNKDNPRTIQISQDTILSAEFAVLTAGKYYFEVQWHFENNTLFIDDGIGDGVMYIDCMDSWELLIPQIQKVVIGKGMTYIIPAEMAKLYNLTSVVWNAVNYTAPASETEAPFYSHRNHITSFEFGKQVKKIPAYLCYEMTNLSSLTIGSNVTNIGKHAFDGCEDLEVITCEATTPPNCGTDAFAGVSIFIPVYVPVSSVDKYAKAPIWKEFDTFSSIQAETKTVSEVQAIPAENSVVMEWPSVADAEIYTIVIKRGDMTFCILSFNAQGQLLGIQFAPSRSGIRRATYATQTTTGWQFTITSLDSGTTYDYTVTAKKDDDTPLYTQSGSFTTTGYMESITTYTVIFCNWNGDILDSQIIEEGNDAIAPANPAREGYTFIGWDTDYTNVQSDLAVTALYAEEDNYFTVLFTDWDGTILKQETVKEGESATPPTNPNRDGYSFDGWSADYTNVQSDLTIVAEYSVANTNFTVIFIDWDGTVLKRETVEKGENATPPADPQRDGYTFSNWKGDFTNVQSNKAIIAVYNGHEIDGTIEKCWTIDEAMTVNGISGNLKETIWDTEAVAAKLLEEVLTSMYQTYAAADVTFNFTYRECEGVTTVAACDEQGNIFEKEYSDASKCWELVETEMLNGIPSSQTEYHWTQEYNMELHKIHYLQNHPNASCSYKEICLYNEDACYEYDGGEIQCEDDIIYYTVRFVDWDETVLKKQTVEKGKNATAPDDPVRIGYKFTGWDKDYTNVHSDLTIMAQYAIKTFMVRFIDWNDRVLKEETVEYGKSATAPSAPTRDGYTFKGWDTEFDNVKSNLEVRAVYEKNADEAIDEINSSNSQTLKLIKHGNLYILRNGEIFNATGARVE